MFAVIKTGGKQYKVSAQDILRVEKLDATAGDTIDFNEVLMLGGESVTLGAPLVDGAIVKAEVLEQTRGDKVISYKKRRRKHSSQRRKGHRQYLTVIKVTDILAKGQKPAAKAEAAVPAGVKPSNLLDAPNGDADDLTKISGVGKGLNEKLNALGVFHYEQIAAWGAEEIAYVDDHLSFKGRIERDDWVAQAKVLAAGDAAE